jgi:chromosome segregation ATPase
VSHDVEALDARLLANVRELLAEAPATEAQLRALIEKTEGWERALRAQLDGSERRLTRLAADRESTIAELARELRRVGRLRPALDDATRRRVRLEDEARRLRTEWLTHQAAPRA